jgi:inosine/xanthosine triphosphate pyrophosphatase family protein
MHFQTTPGQAKLIRCARGAIFDVAVDIRKESPTFGRWHGEVLDTPRGAGGFGYDPLVYIAALGKTVAELDAATKNRVSHRAQAVERMLALLRGEWRLGAAGAGEPRTS